MTVRRPLLALTLIGLAATCAEPTTSGGARGFGGIAIRAHAPPSLAQFAPGLVLQYVDLIIGKSIPQSETFETLDSARVSFADDQNSVSHSFQLLVSEEDTFDIRLNYYAGDGTLLFLASDRVIVRPGATVPTPTLQPFYVGPGSNISVIGMAPRDSFLTAGQGLTLDPLPFDVTGAPVPLFYISWATDDPRVPIDARGHIVAPANLTKLINITATSPNGVVGNNTVSILGPAALGISPDSVEKLPGGTELFRVTVGALRTSQFVWSVNGVDGGNAQFGTISVDGAYTAPSAVPDPSKFQVCARDAAAAPAVRDGCATVIINASPSVGADMVVVNDLDVFDSIATHNAGNIRFIRNLANFSGTGPRASQKGVLHDRSRGDCLQDGACTDGMLVRMDGALTGAGFSVSRLDTPGKLLSIPANVKLLILWLPKVAFDIDEVNLLKRFASEGGRILFIGEHAGYYTQVGLDVENQLLAAMGSQMVNLGSFYDCFADTTAGAFPTIEDFTFTTAATMRAHPLFNGVSTLAYLCASEISLGPNDYALFYDTLNVHLLAGVTKIDVTPSVPPPAAVRQSLRAPTSPGVARRADPFGRKR